MSVSISTTHHVAPPVEPKIPLKSHLQTPTTQQTQSTDAKPQPAATVRLSSPAKSVNVASALQEANETAAQTAKEAAGGDTQAKNLLAREAARK